MRVRADDERGAAVEEVAHRLLLARGLGVEIDDGGVAAVAERAGGELARHRLERVVEGRHEEQAHDVDDEHARAVLRGVDVGAAAGRAGRIVDRAQEPLVPVGEDQRLALVPDVVAGGDAVGAGGDELQEDLLGDAEAAGGVLAVHHDEVEAVPGDQAGQLLLHGRAAGAADDVAEEEEPHASASASISSRSVAIASSGTSCGSSRHALDLLAGEGDADDARRLAARHERRRWPLS